MAEKPEIAIVGGGPAGLTAAIILKNHGYSVRVFEREPTSDYRTQGGSLDLHPDGGQEALRRAGLLSQFHAVARHDDQQAKNVDPWTGETRVDDHESGDHDRPEIDRGVLRELLLSALPTSIVSWGRSFAEIRETDDGRKLLVFADGSHETADIVIGADGAWSCVRRALTSTSPEYSGVTFFEGWLETPTGAQSDYVGKGTLFSFGGPEALFAQRNGLGRICVYAAVQHTTEEIAAQIERQGVSGFVRSAFERWAPQLRDLLESSSEFVPRPIYQLPLGFTWEHRNGILLLGDAAHVMPPLGVGVNLAMLDASDIALAIVSGEDWKDTTQKAQMTVCRRAQAIMQDVIPGFAEWFGPAVGV